MVLNKNKTIALLSGGLDSTTAAAIAIENWEEIIGLSFDYGQRHRKELNAAIQLAKHLTAKNIILYNAYWCPHCHDQKEMFGKEAASNLSLVECAVDGKNNKAELCKNKGIVGYPSWEINGDIQSGIKTLEELSELSGYLGPRDF